MTLWGGWRLEGVFTRQWCVVEADLEGEAIARIGGVGIRMPTDDKEILRESHIVQDVQLIVGTIEEAEKIAKVNPPEGDYML